MVKQWSAGDMTPIEIMEEREAILKLLPQTTPENLTKDYKNISIEPRTRYPNIPIQLIRSQEVRHQYKSDSPDNADVPRYRHPGFQETTTKYQLRKNKPKMNLDALRIARDPNKEREQQSSQSEASAADFYQAMRDKRRNEINASKEVSLPKKVSPERRVSLRRNSSTNDPPPMTLKERIEARRAALLEKDEVGNTPDKNIVNDLASKAEFVRKMSKTFGYGLPSNAESKPDTLTSEAEKCALLVKSASSKNNINKPKRRKSGEQEKTKKKDKSKQQSRDREVDSKRIETWDFSKTQQQKKTEGGSKAGSRLHSSVAPIVPELDIEIDPELDCLLAQLEHDDSFSKLGENEQKAWLESLFFQDTTHLPGRVNNPRDKLNPTKSRPKNSLRVNRDAGEASDDIAEPESVTAVHVNDKMKNVAQDFFMVNDKQTNRKSLPVQTTPDVKPSRKMSESSVTRPSLHSSVSKEDSPLSFIPSPSVSRKSSLASFSTPPTSRKSSEVPEQRPSGSIDDSCDKISGVNDSLCSLAQSYFSSSQQKPAARKHSIKSDSVPPSSESTEVKENDEKANLVASFFGPSGASKTVPKKTIQHEPASTRVPERVSYEPEGQDAVSEDDDDDEIEKLIRAAEKEMKMKEAPPPPERYVVHALKASASVHFDKTQ